MGWVQQIVRHVEVIAVDRHRLAAIDAPGRITEMFDMENLCGIGFRGLTHPDPDEPVTFLHRVGADAGHMRNTLCTRHAGAGAGTVEGQSVIAAFDVVALIRPMDKGSLRWGQASSSAASLPF